jgi:dihydrofolate synthase/folylpolyglutamate synthase
MDYEQACTSLLGLIDYERKNDTPSFDLKGFKDFLARVGSPERDVANPILIAGTKGKGSTAAFIASVLRTAGYTTGLFTSPHLESIRERIQADDSLISEAEFAELMSRLIPLVDMSKSSFRTVFEVLTAMAFIYFNVKKTDVSVLEVGMGGRLDATNVVTPILSVITSISFDHTAILGDSLERIAREKSGIVRPGGTAISSPQPQVVRTVLAEVCSEVGSRLIFSGEDWEILSSSLEGQSFAYRGQEYSIPLLGEHQVENAALAVETLQELGKRGLKVTAADVKTGLAGVEWKGRMQLLSRSPLVMVDGAHNGESALALKKAVSDYLEYDNLIVILGISKTKALKTIIDPLSEIADEIIFTRASLPKAERPERLLEAYDGDVEASTEPDITRSLERAFSIAKVNDLVLITGSLYLVGEAIGLLKSSSRQ